MVSTEDILIQTLEIFGKEVESERKGITINNEACIDKNVPSDSGVYWIETTMPAEEMQQAISIVLNKHKGIRKNPPKGTMLIKQVKQEMYVVYSGTEANISKRLKQHLFNQGNKKTAKLGCKIDEKPFSDYEWKVGYKQINSYEVRYAIESWWRLNIGWPQFCIR